MSFRNYYDKDFDFLLTEELKRNPEYSAIRFAKARLRMYANLYTRDMKKALINLDSICALCNSNSKLHLDHIIPISKGGKNEVNNLQILCSSCNIKKGNR